ncbi:DDE_3 domain-containing protein [Trichonephila clavipes]|nr:DDE_3 domain-containing protein [Trichonephila clavipes]
MPDWNCTRAWWLNHSLGCYFVTLFGIFGASTTLPQFNLVRRVVGWSPLSVYMLFFYPHGNRVSQLDNCTSHKSRLATGWLDKQSSNFYVINWPPRSPDNSYSASLGCLGKRRERPSPSTNELY